MRVIFVRHCLTDWNVKKILQGYIDIPLNVAGLRQAEGLAEALAMQQVSEIVSSDLSRAAQTAAPIGMRLGLKVRCDKRLRECSFGRLEGLAIAEIERLRGAPLPPPTEPYDFRACGGEHREGVLVRNLAVLMDAPAEPSEKARILVGHGRSLNTLLHYLGEPPLPERADWRIVDVRLP